MKIEAKKIGKGEFTPKTIAIDFDGVIHEFENWEGHTKFNNMIPGAKEAIDKLIDELGYTIIIYTCRSRIDAVKSFLKRHGIRYHYINENPYQPEDVSPAKMFADLYIDDRAIQFRNWQQALNDIILRDQQKDALVEVYTFGLKQTYYLEKRQQTLLAFIREHGIEVAIDVRHNRGDRFKNWDCSGLNLSKAIRATFGDTCRYLPLPLLGIPSGKRREYARDPKKMEHWYLNFIHENRELVLSYFDKVRGKKVVLLCIENLKSPSSPYCHRIWLRDWLVGEGIATIGNQEEIE